MGTVPRARLVPSAVTPIRMADVVAAYRDHYRGVGRERFLADVRSFLDAESAATYTSYRRAIVDCLRTLHSTDPERSAVMIPAYSSSDFPAAVEAAGLTVQHCDVEPETLAIDPGTVRDRATEDTLALFAVNLLGFGNRMDELVDVCEANGVHLVEVLGYSLGAEYAGRRLGTFGDAAVINFQEGKPIPVGGGMVTSNRECLDVDDEGRDAVAANVGAMLGYAVFARPRAYFVYETLWRSLDRRGIVSDRVTSHPGSKRGGGYEPPFKTMSDFQGGLAHRVFARLESHRRRRADTARFYAEALTGRDGLGVVRPAPGISNAQYVRYPIVVDSPRRRARLQTALRDAGVQTAALYEGREFDPDRYPGSERLRRGVLTLPTHPYVSPADRRRIVDVVLDVTVEG